MDSPISAVAVDSTVKTNRVVSEYVKEKARHQSQPIRERKRPLNILDLPVDILQLIVKEITHTNDLTALALTHSALHGLATPHIYSRFDIVWPDAQFGSTEFKSVDALTYGLSTLSLGSAFARTVTRSRRGQGNACQSSKLTDNDYAKYTRKFSLGNGPSDWVAEYAVHKESGKMLGTLVASAIARMKNLEAFSWDMPTGVLSRVFEALASLAHQPDNECKLSRVSVRWHDNSQRPVESGALNPNDIVNGTALVPQGSQLTPVGIMLPPNAVHPPPRAPVRYSEYHCEYPAFSVLPPLRNLAVLDIDEVGYLDEMAVLIERSKDILQELRVSISPKAASQAFAQTWDGPSLKQVDHRARWPGESTIGERRLGGVLGVLVGKIYDIKKRRAQDKVAVPAVEISTAADEEVSTAVQAESPSSLDGAQTQQEKAAKTQRPSKGPTPIKSNGRRRLEGKLKLHTLELERVALSLHVCRHAIDWSALTTITLLDCAQHDNLWKMLRKQFQPTPVGGTSSNSKASANASMQYHLALKAIHVDTASTSLISFIKETLAPNSLEDLFLQDRKRGNPPLPLDTVFKGAIKRHYASLRRLLLDSAAKSNGDNIRWRQWALSTDVLLYITSGRMKNLQELAVALNYKDWHTFLQRLPNIPHLRSLNIQHLADYPTGGYDPREVACQIVDIISLRPEIRLCYVGAGPKCFEILESPDTAKDRSAGSSGASTPVTAAAAAMMAGLGVGGSVDGGGTGGHDPYGLVESEEEEEGEEEDDEDEEVEDEVEVEHEEEEVGAITVAPVPAGGSVAASGADGGDGDPDEEDDLETEGEGDDDEGVDDDGDNTPTTATNTTAATSDPDETEGEDEDAGGMGQGGEGDGDEDEDDDGFVEPGRGGARLKLREILFYDDKVAIFKARHGHL